MSVVAVSHTMLIRRITIQTSTKLTFVSEIEAQTTVHRSRWKIRLLTTIHLVCCVPCFISAFGLTSRTTREHLMNFVVTTVFAGTVAFSWGSYISCGTVSFFKSTLEGCRELDTMYLFKHHYRNGVQSVIVFTLFIPILVSGIFVMQRAEHHGHNYVVLCYIVCSFSILAIAISLMLSLRMKHKQIANKVVFFS